MEILKIIISDISVDMQAIKEFLTKTQVKERGWTDKLIKMFLGDPDKLTHNTFYRSAAPIMLFKITRVEECESSIEWLDANKSAIKRKASARKATQTKTDIIIAEIESLAIDVRYVDEHKLFNDAIESYNDHQYFRENYGNVVNKNINKEENRSFLDRIKVNYIRHNLTIYDNALELTWNKVGKQNAINALRRKIYLKIIEVYPDLKNECCVQCEARGVLLSIA